jgi:replicative DNA helicase
MKMNIDDIIHENVYPAWKAGEAGSTFAYDQFINANSPDYGRLVTKFNMPSLDAYLNPFVAGDLITILGRPQNGKTLLSMYLLDQKLKDLMKMGLPNQVVILVTLEVSVERSAIYQIARMAGIGVRDIIRGEIDGDDYENLEVAALEFGTMPLFIVGHSTKRSADNKRKRPELSMTNIEKAIDYIMNEYTTAQGDKLEPGLIVIDYLQRIHKSKNQRGILRPELMLVTVDKSKDLAIWAGCPVVLNVQAGRQVDERDIKMPGMSDGQWSSNIEQSSDFSFGVWMPKTAGLKRTKPFANIPSLDVSDNLMIIGVLKQKDGPAGSMFPIYVDPNNMKLGELQLDYPM